MESQMSQDKLDKLVAESEAVVRDLDSLARRLTLVAACADVYLQSLAIVCQLLGVTETEKAGEQVPLLLPLEPQGRK